jgi:hypothetical protein
MKQTFAEYAILHCKSRNFNVTEQTYVLFTKKRRAMAAFTPNRSKQAVKKT